VGDDRHRALKVQRSLAISTRTSLLLAAGLLSLAGCASNGRVREIGPGLYSASARGDGYVSSPRLREQSLDRAQEFCARQGKRMLPRGDSKETQAGSDTTISVTFRCVDG
jgi:hypothetical protein